jgi:hypothetical protein
VLVLALGARARAAVPGAVTFRDQRDAAHLQRVVDELRSGTLNNLALTAPPGVSWTLPIYELALLAAETERLGLHTSISLITPALLSSAQGALVPSRSGRCVVMRCVSAGLLRRGMARGGGRRSLSAGPMGRRR